MHDWLNETAKCKYGWILGNMKSSETGRQIQFASGASYHVRYVTYMSRAFKWCVTCPYWEDINDCLFYSAVCLRLWPFLKKDAHDFFLSYHSWFVRSWGFQNGMSCLCDTTWPLFLIFGAKNKLWAKNLSTSCKRRYYSRFLISITISAQFKTKKTGPKIKNVGGQSYSQVRKDVVTTKLINKGLLSKNPGPDDYFYSIRDHDFS